MNEPCDGKDDACRNAIRSDVVTIARVCHAICLCVLLTDLGDFIAASAEEENDEEEAAEDTEDEEDLESELVDADKRAACEERAEEPAERY